MMIRNTLLAALGVASLCTVSTTAHTHATLETQQAPADNYYKAVVRTPHGCSGSPTIAVRVRIPDGVTAVKPQPKPGWDVAVVREALATPTTDRYGNAITERVTEVSWTGGRLLDEHYDEFVMRVRLPDTPGETLYFQTVQECEEGVDRWIEIPEPGRTRADYKFPAPQVTLLPRD